MAHQAFVYPLTEEQSVLLTEANTDLIIFAPLWADDLDGVYIEPETLEDPAFINHKAIFDSFDPPVELVEVTLPDYSDFF